MIEADQFVSSAPRVFEEQHYPIRYWASRWAFSMKTVREWFRDEYGPGILRQKNVGRRLKRDYIYDDDLAQRGGARVRETQRTRGNPLIKWIFEVM
jgi:hypothetical protein